MAVEIWAGMACAFAGYIIGFGRGLAFGSRKLSDTLEASVRNSARLHWVALVGEARKAPPSEPTGWRSSRAD